MPFDSFDSFSLLDSSFDSFASIYAFTVNARMREEVERLEREIQQKNERHERVMLFLEWYACKHINLNGSTNDFERQLSEVMPQFNMFLDEIDGKSFEMECPGCGLVIKAPTKKGVLRCPHCDRFFHIDARIALADASEDRPEDTAS